MNYNDLTDEQKEIWDEGYSAGHDAGYDQGFDDGIEAEPEDEAYEAGEYAGFESGFEKGVLAERQRVQDVLNMMFESALNMGQGNKAVQYKQAMDLLIPPPYEYDPERYQKDLENDGF